LCNTYYRLLVCFYHSNLSVVQTNRLYSLKKLERFVEFIARVVSCIYGHRLVRNRVDDVAVEGIDFGLFDLE